MDIQRPDQPATPGGRCDMDQDIFLRVWDRVMPEAGEACPIVVERSREQTEGNGAKRQGTEPAGDDFPTREDVPCLGSSGMPDSGQLQMFTAQELLHWKLYQALARRNGQGGRLLAAMADGCRKRAKRLSAALFLISGIRFWPSEHASAPMPRSYLGVLREQFFAEQNRGQTYRAAAEGCRDMCLQALYLDLADECMEYAQRIRTLLENT